MATLEQDVHRATKLAAIAARSSPVMIVTYPIAWREDAEAHKLATLKTKLAETYANYIAIPGDVDEPDFRVHVHGMDITPSATTPRDLRPLAFSLLACLMSLIALLVSLGVV